MLHPETPVTRQLRRLKWTYATLGEACGWSTSKAMRLCQGVQQPTPEQRAQILDALGVEAHVAFPDQQFEGLDSEHEAAARVAQWLTSDSGLLLLRELRKVLT